MLDIDVPCSKKEKIKRGRKKSRNKRRHGQLIQALLLPQCKFDF